MRELGTEEHNELRREIQELERRYAQRLLNEAEYSPRDATLARLRVAGVLECAAAADVESHHREASVTEDEASAIMSAIRREAPQGWTDIISSHVHAMATLILDNAGAVAFRKPRSDHDHALSLDDL